MRIIESKCPGCGANVKFNESDNKGICEYCKKEFTITKDPQEEFLLSVNEFSKDVMKQVSSSFKISRIMFFIVFFIALAIILFVFIKMFTMI